MKKANNAGGMPLSKCNAQGIMIYKLENFLMV